jgi:ribosomal protein S27AE
MKMQKLNFVCPDCGGTVLQEILENCVVATKVASFREEEANYGEDKDVSGGYINRFQCGKCGWIVRCEAGTIIDNSEDLLEHCKKKGWILKQELTAKEIQTYISEGGLYCINCVDEDIQVDGDIPTFDRDRCTVDVICARCGYRWRDIYTLTGAEDR